MRALCYLLTVLSLTLGAGSVSAQSFLGPSPYFSFDDSPFRSQLGTASFFLEDFEGLALHAPGVSIDNGSVRGLKRGTDSVDGDDGRINGRGRGGHSWFFKRGRQGV
jgi:hypothetical protein